MVGHLFRDKGRSQEEGLGKILRGGGTGRRRIQGVCAKIRGPVVRREEGMNMGETQVTGVPRLRRTSRAVSEYATEAVSSEWAREAVTGVRRLRRTSRAVSRGSIE